MLCDRKEVGRRGRIALATHGQGVIEYSGALIIATVIVAAGLIVIPPGFSAMINTIYALTDQMLQSFLQQ